MSKQGKEVRVREKANKDPIFDGMNGEEFFNNRLSLSNEIKTILKDQGFDWRFINAAQFRSDGNMHRSHWKPYRFDESTREVANANAEGYIQRGDLILAVRKKEVTAKAKAFLKGKNDLLRDTNKLAAQDLRRQLRGSDSKIHEGYDEDETGFKEAE